MLEQSKKYANLITELVNVGFQLAAKKGFFVVFQLSDEAAQISSVDYVALKAEWVGKPFKPNAEELVAACKAKLSIENIAAKAKIEKGLDLIPKAADLVEKGLADVAAGKQFIEDVKAVFA